MPGNRKTGASADAPEKIIASLTGLLVNIDDIHNHPRNYNRHERIEEIKKSLTSIGQYKPVLVESATGHVLAGNGVLIAAKALGWRRIAAAHIDVDDDTATRILLWDNKSTSFDWDYEQLAELLGETGVDGTGWTADEYRKMLADLETPLPGDGEQPTQADMTGDGDTVHTVPGDIWLLGKHRLMCADAADTEALDALLGPLGKPGIVYTDPPYGINAVGKGGTVGGGDRRAHATRYRPVAGDDGKDTAAAAFRALTARFPDVHQIWWGANHYAATAAIPDASGWLVWDKNNGTTDFADAELAWTNTGRPARLLRHTWNGMMRASEKGVRRVHPTQKPVALAVWAFGIVDPEHRAAVVLDVFAGSGSTLIAAHDTNRTAALMELEPGYCDAICRRFQEHTGIVPVCETTGVIRDFVGGA